jgi:hypothetical protein
MFDFSQPTYKQTLSRTKQDLKSERLFPSFWRKPSAWPNGGKTKIFVCDAINAVGRLKFGDVWTGKEFAAYQRMDEFPSFAQTLAEFHHDLNEWQSSQNPGHVYEAVVPPQWEARYKRAYDHTAQEWENDRQANIVALGRLNWVVDWLANQTRDGELETYLRPVDNVESSRMYEPAPEGFWLVEDILWTRLNEQGRSSDRGSRFDSGETGSLYIFFDKASFDLAALKIALPPEISPALDVPYLSPFMRLALAVIHAEGLTETYQSKVDSVRDTVRRLAPSFGIDLDDNKIVLKYLATIVRDPDSKRGRRPKMGQSLENG